MREEVGGRAGSDSPAKGNPSSLIEPQSSVLICAMVKLATFLPT